MNNFMPEPFVVKRLEKLAKRKLTELERAGEIPVRYKSVNGDVMFEKVPQINMKTLYGGR